MLTFTPSAWEASSRAAIFRARYYFRFGCLVFAIAAVACLTCTIANAAPDGCDEPRKKTMDDLGFAPSDTDLCIVEERAPRQAPDPEQAATTEDLYTFTGRRPEGRLYRATPSPATTSAILANPDFAPVGRVTSSAGFPGGSSRLYQGPYSGGLSRPGTALPATSTSCLDIDVCSGSGVSDDVFILSQRLNVSGTELRNTSADGTLKSVLLFRMEEKGVAASELTAGQKKFLGL